ncbi:MAG: hypothetical protein IJU23_07070 [Proteobacteria bacterium]|nr:hypothetical protein [Pseudomonadota bacterium]
MKKLVLLLAILIPFTFAACSKKADDAVDSKVELAKAEAEKAKAEAEKAKAEAEKVKAEAGKAEAEANKAEAEANKAQAEADKAMAEAMANEGGVGRFTPPEELPELDGKLNPKGLVLFMGVRPIRGIKTVRVAGTEEGTYIIEELYDRTIAFSSERRKSMGNVEEEYLHNLTRKIDTSAHDIEVSKDDKMSAQMTYPSWKITYESGFNEDTRKCIDYYVQTEEFDYRFHTSIDSDEFDSQSHHLEAWFDNLELREL